mmetsp:Transcript_62125/g.115255  ORF Transcript_62125/g.115255 Transcript_62125/m.115255 type:complete len:152 (-) Transcript_62125:59-514(-)
MFGPLTPRSRTHACCTCFLAISVLLSSLPVGLGLYYGLACGLSSMSETLDGRTPRLQTEGNGTQGPAADPETPNGVDSLQSNVTAGLTNVTTGLTNITTEVVRNRSISAFCSFVGGLIVDLFRGLLACCHEQKMKKFAAVCASFITLRRWR